MKYDGKFASRWRAKSPDALCAVLPLLCLHFCFWLIGRGAVLIREHFQALHAQNYYAADEEEHNAERVQSHCRLRIFQRGRSHKDGVQGTQHHADDQIYRSPAVFGQGVLDQLDNADDAGNDTQPKDDQNGQHVEIQVEQVVNAVNDRNVQPEDQQQRGTGNARQNHGTDRNGSHEECVDVHADAGITQIFSAAYKSVGIGDRHHECHADEDEEAHFPAVFQYLFFLVDHDRNREDDEADEQGGYPIDMGFKDICQHQHRGAEADRPADAQLDEVLDSLDAFLLAAGDQGVQGTDKVVIEAHEECDRAAGNAGDTVCQCHTETVQKCN